MTRARRGHNETKEAMPTDGATEPAAIPPEPAISLRPAQCRGFVRGELAKAMPQIAREFVKQANGGSVSHLTLLSKLGGFDLRPLAAPPQRRGKSATRRLLDELRSQRARALSCEEPQRPTDRAAQ